MIRYHKYSDIEGKVDYTFIFKYYELMISLPEKQVTVYDLRTPKILFNFKWGF